MKVPSKLLQVISLLVPFFLNAQDENFDIPNLTPPSPSAFELGNFGSEKVGLFTGTAQVAIPVYEYSTANLKVPITLSYNSNGILVNQVSTDVGLGWNLMAEGVISRTARDGADENNAYFFPEEEISEVGVQSPMALEFFYAAGQDVVDTETDLFSFNFSGYSGKFVIDNDRKIVQLPKTPLKIENYSNGFQITTPEGVRYIFLEEEVSISRVSGAGHSVPELPIVTAWYLSQIVHPKGDVVNFLYESNNYSYTASESQTLKVAISPYETACGQSIDTQSIFPGPNQQLQTNLTHNGKRLLEISSNNDASGTVSFQSNIFHPLSFGMVTNIKVKNIYNDIIEDVQLDYLFTQANRAFLESVSFLDPDKVYNLSYINPESFPARLSFSQDHWGYYNGKNNSYLFPNPQTLGPNIHTSLAAVNIGADKSPNHDFARIGLLEKIKYPTKGATVLDYEANSYWGEEIKEPNPARRELSILTDETQMGIHYDEKFIKAPKKQEIKVYASTRFNGNCEDLHDVGKSKATFTIQDQTTNEYLTLYKKSQSGSKIYLGEGFTIEDKTTDSFYAQIDKNISYAIRLTVNYKCIDAGANVEYYDKLPTVNETNISTGGLRIKSLSQHDADGSMVKMDRYYYGRKESKDKSSAEQGVKPFYISPAIQRISCGDGTYGEFNYLHLQSNSLRKFYKTSGMNSTFYKYVTTSYGDDNFGNGGQENEFIIHHDYFGNPLLGDAVETAPLTNFGWSNGLEKKVSKFKKDSSGNFIVLEEKENFYHKDERLYDEVYAYAVEKKYDQPYAGEITYQCKPEDLDKIYYRYYCATDHKHQWGPKPFDGRDEWVCLHPDADDKDEIIPHPCYGKTESTIITRQWYLDNLNITEYKSISYWHYLSSQSIKKYDENGNNPVTTVQNFYYDNPKHLQVNREESENSKGERILSRRWYSEDVEDPLDLGLEALTLGEMEAIEKMKSYEFHFTGVPIQSEKKVMTVNDQLLSKNLQRTGFALFNNLILPKDVKTSKGNRDIELRLSYEQYDENGNPLEISREGGPTAVYIWGYDNQYPVAKVEKASYNDAIGLINHSIINDVGTSEEVMLAELQKLRDGLPEAMITSFTYKPLLGVTSITDPKGEKFTYHYDSFNRLQFIKDSEGNIVKEHQYKYQTQN